jgi:ATP phosphoribosyltransferase regulatory subunit HisZ
MTTEFRYPTGTRPLLIEETARRRRIETRFVSVLERFGYAEIVLPIIDFAEPYADITDPASARQSYRFTDRDGELVAIRADFTPIVARTLAPFLRDSPQALPLRVFYRGDVVRCQATRLGANREMFQIGGELIGDATASADLEILRVVATIAAAFCDSPLVVHTGTELDEELAGDSRFTLSGAEEDRSAGYYTGLRFWVYGDDRRRPLAQGGRYDALYGRFGTDAPAVGFTFTVDELESGDIASAVPGLALEVAGGAR